MTQPTRRSLPVRLLKALGSGLCFVMWGVGATVLAWIVLPITRLRMRRASANAKTRAAQRITGRGNGWLMHMMRWCRQVHFDPRKQHLALPDGPFVMVANHPTLVDVCALTSINPEMCVIAKPKMTRSWFVGRALRAAGHIEAPRKGGSAFGGAAVITSALERLEQGFPVLIFPEGTRSTPGTVGRLSRGAFEIAKRANVPIVGVVIHADPPTLCKGMRWYSLPKKTSMYTIKALPPVHIEDIGGTSKAAAAYFHQQFTAQLARMTTDEGAVDALAGRVPSNKPEPPHESPTARSRA